MAAVPTVLDAPATGVSAPASRAARASASRPRAASRRAFGVLAFTAGLLAVLYLVISGYMALTLTKPARKPFEKTPETYGLRPEQVETVAFPSRVDGLRLEGWLLSPPPGITPRGRPVVVVHGKGSDRTGALGVSADLVQSGRRVLTLDLRAAGRSEGERFTLGAQEVRDVGGAIDELAGRGLAPDGVSLLGYSMGAATAMLVAPGEPAVRALVEDSGYADLGDVLEDQVPKVSGLPGFFTPGVVLLARPLIGVDAYSIRPIDGMRTLAERRVPLFVIHGQADTVVPFSHSTRLLAAYGPSAERLLTAARHTGSYDADPRQYVARLTAFLDRAE